MVDDFHGEINNIFVGTYIYQYRQGRNVIGKQLVIGILLWTFNTNRLLEARYIEPSLFWLVEFPRIPNSRINIFLNE